MTFLRLDRIVLAVLRMDGETGRLVTASEWREPK
jgi:hypothetical protein